MSYISPNTAEIKMQAVTLHELPPRPLLSVIDDIDDKLHNIETLIRSALFYLPEAKCKRTEKKVTEFLIDACEERNAVQQCSDELSTINMGALS